MGWADEGLRRVRRDERWGREEKESREGGVIRPCGDLSLCKIKTKKRSFAHTLSAEMRAAAGP